MVDTGAYSVWPFTACLEAAQAGGNLPGPYDLAAYRCKTYSVATNKPPFAPYRGVARPGVCFAIELTIDAIARAVGREAWEVRAENLVPAAAMPYTNITGKHYDSGDYPASLLTAKDMIGLRRASRRRAARCAGPLSRRSAFATYTEQTAHGTKVFAAWGLPLVPGYDQAFVKLTPDGALEVKAGIPAIGQGLETTLAQIAHEMTGVPFDTIRVTLGDTATTPFSTGAYASRGIVMSGGAVSRAAEVVAGRIKAIAAHLLQVRPDDVTFRDGAHPCRRGQPVLRRYRPRLVRAARTTAGRCQYRRPGGDRGLQARRRYRPVLLRHPRRARRGRCGNRPGRNPRLRHRRGLRPHGEPDDRRGPGLRRRRARRRHRAVRGMPVQRRTRSRWPRR